MDGRKIYITTKLFAGRKNESVELSRKGIFLYSSGHQKFHYVFPGEIS